MLVSRSAYHAVFVAPLAFFANDSFKESKDASLFFKGKVFKNGLKNLNTASLESIAVSAILKTAIGT